MDQFKAFLHLQVGQIWKQLDELLLLQTQERIEDIVPVFSLSNLRDNSTNRVLRWNFLHCPTIVHFLPDGSHWLLLRVLKNASYKETFYNAGNRGEPTKWRAAAA